MQHTTILAGLITSMAISWLAIPSIVGVARGKGLYDTAREPGSSKTPTLGGLAIFAGVIISLNLYADPSFLPELNFLSASALILFFIGLKDDILLIAPWWKLLGQLGVALITVLVMVTVINAINLIDGIDGLAGIRRNSCHGHTDHPGHVAFPHSWSCTPEKKMNFWGNTIRSSRNDPAGKSRLYP